MSRLILLLLLLTGISANSQEKWTIYDTTNSPLPDNQVQAIAIDQHNVKWIGTSKGLVRLSGTQWTIYDSSNTALPSSEIYSLAIDKNGTVWVGTNNGLASFDGQAWTTWLPDRMVNKLLYDAKTNTLWISTEKALHKYNGGQFTTYDVSNSLLFDTFIINSLAIDQKGMLYIGVFDTFQFNGRLMTFDGTNWDMTRLESHELTSTFPYALTVDAQNRLWMGTGGTTGGVLVSIQNNQWQVYDRVAGANALLVHNGHLWAAGNGLTRYDGKEFTRFDTKNSPLPDNYTYALAADGQGGIWTGTIGGGVAVYAQEQKPGTSLVLQNYPNPFLGATTIEYEIPNEGFVQMSIFNTYGQLVQVLVDKNMPAGKHTIQNKLLSAGIYFCQLNWNGHRVTRKLIRN